jgi:3-hydroxyisobutyrate dehydrogenase-like beta-hydroxyacid dehydrogenase
MARSVGFIGLGIMGRAMARRLIDAGFRVAVWNRDASKAAELVTAGATLAATPRAAAEGADVVITIVTDSAAVEAVILGPDGVAQGAKAGTIVVDMTTIHPSAARKIGIALKKQGVGFLDAPVTGMEFRAKDGTLSILVGGEKEDLRRPARCWRSWAAGSPISGRRGPVRPRRPATRSSAPSTWSASSRPCIWAG